VDGTVFHESKKLYAEKILVNEIFSADFVTKSGNYFIISSSKSDTTLFLYEIPSLKFKNATGRKGGGPNEIQTYPVFCHTLDDEYLYIRGYSHMSIRKISIAPDGNFSFIDEYQLDKYDGYNFMNIIRDSLLIYYNGSDQLAITKYDLKNKTELKKINLKKDAHKESYYYSNRGFTAANDSFVVFPYLYKKQIDIYTVDNFELIKRIDDGKQYPKVAVYDNENIIYHYFNIYAGKKYFYAIYVGHKNDDNFLDRTLEVYDYKGNPIIKYTFDIVPFYFVVDEENGYIYATNSNYEDYLLRYKL
jgi:WD40 repeat protein